MTDTICLMIALAAGVAAGLIEYILTKPLSYVRHKKLLRKYRGRTEGYQSDKKVVQSSKKENVYKIVYDYEVDHKKYKKQIKEQIMEPENIPVKVTIHYDKKNPVLSACEEIVEKRGYRFQAVVIGVLFMIVTFGLCLAKTGEFQNIFAQSDPKLAEFYSRPQGWIALLLLIILFVVDQNLIYYFAFDRMDKKKKKAIKMGHVIHAKRTKFEQMVISGPFYETYEYEINGVVKTLKFSGDYSKGDYTHGDYLLLYYTNNPRHFFYDGEKKLSVQIIILLIVAISFLAFYGALLVLY